MNKVAQFEKVSFSQFKESIKDIIQNISDKEIQEMYDNIKLPKRATKGSAGYDFCTPISFVLEPNKTIKFPTGIRCKIDEGWVLKIYPRSGLGFKYRLQLDNSVGIIDSDYYYSDNEGNIFLKMTNCSNANKVIGAKSGDAIAQGIFIEYGVTIDDDKYEKEVRNGGFGSTSK